MCRKAFAAAVGVLVLSGAAGGMMVDIPMPCLIADSDLIVICEVVAVDGPMKLPLQPPGMQQPIHAFWSTATVTVTEVIRDPHNALAAKKGEREKQIKIIAQAPRPQVPGQFRPIMADGPAYPKLAVGEKYLVILGKFADKPEYYLPAYPKNFRRLKGGDDDFVKQVRSISDVAKWPWGKAAGGLQLALVPSTPHAYVRKVRTTRTGPTPERAYVQMVCVLRNTTDKPIHVNLFPGDKCLEVSYWEKDQSPKRCDLYSWLARARLRAFGPTNIKTIAPGGLLGLSPQGHGRYGMSVTLDVQAGQVRLKAKYRTVRDATDEKGGKLWKGELTSGEATVEIKALPPRAPRAIPARQVKLQARPAQLRPAQRAVKEDAAK